MMETAFNTIGTVAAGLAFGGMVFFALVIAPTVFTKLGEKDAAALIRAIFPKYYLFVAVTAGVGALTLLTTFPWASLGLAVAALGALLSRQGLMPRINGARDQANAGDSDAEARFERLHNISVRVNGLGLIGALGAVVILGLGK